MVTARPGWVLENQFRRYRTPLFIAIATFGLGAVFGSMAISTLTVADKALLMDYVHRFIVLEAARPVGPALFTSALANNLKLLGLIYIMGVSVAGMPLVPIVLFFRGFVAGFAVAFLTTTMAWQGIWLTVITIGLQSLFIVPATLLTSAVALGFSWSLIFPQTRSANQSVLQNFVAFTILVALMGMVAVVGTACETAVAPFLLHLLGTWGI